MKEEVRTEKRRGKWLFFMTSLLNYREVGMLLPSNRKVCENIVSLIPWHRVRGIIEVGAGTGQISKAILNHIPSNGQLICVEKNSEFCEFLKKSLEASNATVVNMAFEDLLTDDRYRNFEADCVVLSLPASFASEIQQNKWIDVSGKLLKDKGLLIIHQCVPVMGERLKTLKWTHLNSKWVVGFPPFRVDLFEKSNSQLAADTNHIQKY